MSQLRVKALPVRPELASDCLRRLILALPQFSDLLPVQGVEATKLLLDTRQQSRRQLNVLRQHLGMRWHAKPLIQRSRYPQSLSFPIHLEPCQRGVRAHAGKPVSSKELVHSHARFEVKMRLVEKILNHSGTRQAFHLPLHRTQLHEKQKGHGGAHRNHLLAQHVSSRPQAAAIVVTVPWAARSVLAGCTSLFDLGDTLQRQSLRLGDLTGSEEKLRGSAKSGAVPDQERISKSCSSQEQCCFQLSHGRCCLLERTTDDLQVLWLQQRPPFLPTQLPAARRQQL
mmetsp:Transcript_69193/g.162625  ORF Transcript_69193/g.162625 Transcript_69193/m.162625 type:complete len:284 (-) Transcript_69193:2099-2950(-)